MFVDLPGHRKFLGKARATLTFDTPPKFQVPKKFQIKLPEIHKTLVENKIPKLFQVE
jgi:hypothetical protein